MVCILTISYIPIFTISIVEYFQVFSPDPIHLSIAGLMTVYAVEPATTDAYVSWNHLYQQFKDKNFQDSGWTTSVYPEPPNGIQVVL